MRDNRAAARLFERDRDWCCSPGRLKRPEDAFPRGRSAAIGPAGQEVSRTTASARKRRQRAPYRTRARADGGPGRRQAERALHQAARVSVTMDRCARPARNRTSSASRNSKPRVPDAAEASPEFPASTNARSMRHSRPGGTWKGGERPQASLTHYRLRESAGLARDLAPEESDYQAVVSEVQDGDSLIVTRNGPNEVVRLAEVDVPEPPQPYGSEARGYVTGLLMGLIVVLVLPSHGARDEPSILHERSPVRVSGRPQGRVGRAYSTQFDRHGHSPQLPRRAMSTSPTPCGSGHAASRNPSTAGSVPAGLHRPLVPPYRGPKSIRGTAHANLQKARRGTWVVRIRP